MTILVKLLIVLFLIMTTPAHAQTKTPYIYILGVAQDAGFPQAGCYKPHCMQGWKSHEKRLSATSLAVIDSENHKKYLFEATPNLPEQLFLLEQEAPNSSLAGIFITHAHMGHYTGLMYLGREAMGANHIPVYVMPKMEQYLRNNGPWSQLVKLKNIVLEPLLNGRPMVVKSLEIIPILVPHRDEFSETVGFSIKGPNKTALFIPDINKWSQWEKNIVDQIKASDYALIDATFYDRNELPGRDMSKIPHPFVMETMDALSQLSDQHRSKVWFIHMNHTNPLLNLNSEQSQVVRNRGFNIASLGLRLPL